MKLIFAEKAWEGYLHWQKTDRKRISEVIHLLEKLGELHMTVLISLNRSSMPYLAIGLDE